MIGPYRAYLRLFGTWNNAIRMAGFEPNPVLFAKKFIAKDGHICDSLTERIIDDWLFKKNLKHKIHVPYPNSNMTADFVVGDVYIEFFGLAGVVKKYDKLIKKKQMLCKKQNLTLIEIYPKDLFPVNRLSKIVKIKS